MEGISFAEPQSAVAGLTEPRRVREDGLEYGLQIAWRCADDAEDLGGRCLLLQRFAQLAAARLEFAPVAAPPGSQQVNKALPHGATSPRQCYAPCAREWPWHASEWAYSTPFMPAGMPFCAGVRSRRASPPRTFAPVACK